MEWIVSASLIVTATGITLWIIGAVYYDLCHGTRWGPVAAIGCATGVAVLFAVWQPLWQPFVVLLVGSVLFLNWWLRLKPSHNRSWDPSVAVRNCAPGEVVYQPEDSFNSVGFVLRGRLKPVKVDAQGRDRRNGDARANPTYQASPGPTRSTALSAA